MSNSSTITYADLNELSNAEAHNKLVTRTFTRGSKSLTLREHLASRLRNMTGPEKLVVLVHSAYSDDAHNCYITEGR